MCWHSLCRFSVLLVMVSVKATMKSLNIPGSVQWQLDSLWFLEVSLVITNVKDELDSVKSTIDTSHKPAVVSGNWPVFITVTLVIILVTAMTENDYYWLLYTWLAPDYSVTPVVGVFEIDDQQKLNVNFHNVHVSQFSFNTKPINIFV